jgi:hypothetical protein
LLRRPLDDDPLDRLPLDELPDDPPADEPAVPLLDDPDESVALPRPDG